MLKNQPLITLRLFNLKGAPMFIHLKEE